MISVKIAIETSQKVNRDAWLKATGDKLSAKIMETAKTGLRALSVPFDSLIIGAENLFEGGEMLLYLHKMLNEVGFTHVIKPDGTLIISW